MEAFCPCLRWLRNYQENRRFERDIEVLRQLTPFRRRVIRLGILNTSVSIHAQYVDDYCLRWKARVENEDPDVNGGWHEVDLSCLKVVEDCSSLSFALISKTGDLLLEIEAEDSETKETWLTALHAVSGYLIRNPQQSTAKSSFQERLSRKAKAHKHFAKRSIELQEKKQAAEARKAKYMEGAGGLKYTALAMASREV